MDLPVTVRGHPEILLPASAPLLPLLLSRDRTIGLCFEVEPALDTSRWEALLTFDRRPSPGGAAPPAARMATTVCFDGIPPPGLDETGSPIELCARVVDRYDGSTLRTPCAQVAYLPAKAPLREGLMAALDDLRGGAYRHDRTALLDELDRLAAVAGEGGLPLLQLHFDLLAVYFLTQDRDAVAMADGRHRLRRLPPWLDEEAAHRAAAHAAVQRARLHLASGPDYRRAWEALAEAERRLVRIADGDRLAVTMRQAAILSRMGSLSEAMRRLRVDLSYCEGRPCDRETLAHGHDALAWLILLDPEASEAEFAEASGLLDSARQSLDPERHLLEHANLWLNSALLAVRTRQDPRPALDRARTLLGRTELGADRAAFLATWGDLIEGLEALRVGDAERARALCERHARHGDPALAASIWSCRGQAHHLEGRLELAATAFDNALLHHRLGPLGRFDQGRSLGPSQRAEDFGRAAVVAIERGDPGGAWRLLLELDRLAAHEGERRRCREAADPDQRRRWLEIEAETRALLEELNQLERPASGARRQALQPVLRKHRERLLELWREWPGCAGRMELGDRGVQYRAVAVADEVILLHRRPDGRVHVARRTALDRRRLRSIIDRMSAAMGGEAMDDEAWATLLQPVAAALLPPELERLEPVTPFALHGMLQEIPLAALPLPAPDGRRTAARWLGEIAAPVHRPPGARSGGAPPRDDRAVSLFIVDPRGDLAATHGSLPLYRTLFPEAEILHGDDADAEGIRRAVGRASWIHIDAHGIYDPVFPELSAVRLADRALGFSELADLAAPWRFANLSGCRTGLWPTTADSGRYGLGGLMSRLGVRWVIASRAALPDRVARDFNDAFYRATHRGRSVPTAYREALNALSGRHPASSWAGILLLGEAADAEQRQNRAAGDSLEIRGATPSPDRLDGAEALHRDPRLDDKRRTR